MNGAIRKWIEENRQPWRHSQEQSALRGRAGASGALPLNPDTLKYFQRRGIATQGKFIEELLEGEVLAVLATVSGWLPDDDRKRLDESIAFGFGRTYEAMAVTIPCLDGYAILFGDTFDTLLISAIDLYFGFLLEPKIVTAGEFPVALNTAIVSTFFHRAHYWTPIPVNGFTYRELTSSWLWLMDVFILSHEIGHVVRGHLETMDEHEVALSGASGEEVVTVVRADHELEFVADRYAIELMRSGETSGGLIHPDADRKTFWNSAYMTLSWLFSILGAVEKIRLRLDAPSVMTHPEASARWVRLESIIRECAPIDDKTILIADRMRVNAYRSADLGDLPQILNASENEEGLVPLPYSEDLADLLRAKSAINERSVALPSNDLLMTWINASTVSEAKTLLLRHSELLDPNVDLWHYALADKQQDAIRRHHILVKRLPLLERSREIGVEAAFAELAGGGRPNNEAEAPLFELRVDLLEQYLAALQTGNTDSATKMLDASPELTAFIALPTTVERLANTGTPDQTKQFLLEHPELLVPTVDGIFEALATAQESTAARQKVEAFRAIVARAREFGVARAIAEARLRWG